MRSKGMSGYATFTGLPAVFREWPAIDRTQEVNAEAG